MATLTVAKVRLEQGTGVIAEGWLSEVHRDDEEWFTENQHFNRLYQIRQKTVYVIDGVEHAVHGQHQFTVLDIKEAPMCPARAFQ